MIKIAPTKLHAEYDLYAWCDIKSTTSLHVWNWVHKGTRQETNNSTYSLNWCLKAYFYYKFNPWKKK